MRQLLRLEILAAVLATLVIVSVAGCEALKPLASIDAEIATSTEPHVGDNILTVDSDSFTTYLAVGSLAVAALAPIMGGLFYQYWLRPRRLRQERNEFIAEATRQEKARAVSALATMEAEGNGTNGTTED